MKEVITKWTLGNFSVELKASVLDDVHSKLAELGLRFLGQRVSSVDKVLGGFEEKEGKLKRKPGFKRGDVTYDTVLAQRLLKEFGELELPDGTKLKMEDVNVTEYVPAEGSAPKFKEEREIAGRHESKGDLDEWLKAVVKFEGESHTADGEDFSPAMLAAVKAWKVEMLKSM